MIIFLDNAESILDPRGADAREIYAVVEELSQFKNICLGITSRISTVPPSCESFDIPTLSMEAGRDTFYRIYKSNGRSDLVNGILGQLDFHPLSLTLLATVAHHNKWDTGRLTKEWERRRTDMLHTQHDTSLATTIELSLASPMFQELGPDARDLLGVIAFFPQGINEDNLDWPFPALPNMANIFDNFCVLSLTYRNNGFVTMLAPLRDHLCPKNPASSPLLHATKDSYFRRLSVEVGLSQSGFEVAQWIISEDANIEHLLNVFTSRDAHSVGVWDACASFVGHLSWHKPRLVLLGAKIEGLSDDHPSKPRCLFWLSRLFGAVGNHMERKRLIVHTLRLWRERGNDFEVAETLRILSDANRWLGLRKEGIRQAKEALEMYKRFNNMSGQTRTWKELALLLYEDNQLDAAEGAALQVIDISGDKVVTSECHRVLGEIYYSKGETEKAINHFETSTSIASPFSWHDQLFWNHYSLAQLFFGEDRFDDADAHIGHAKSHAINAPYLLGRAMELQAEFWHQQGRFKEARSEALRAADAYEKIGAMEDVEDCRAVLRDIEKAENEPVASHD